MIINKRNRLLLKTSDEMTMVAQPRRILIKILEKYFSEIK